MSTADAAQSHYIYGQQALNEGRLEDALDAFSAAIQSKPGFAAAFYQRGNTLRRLDRPEAAEQELREAIRLAPQLADPYFSLTFLLRDQGRIKDIEETLRSLADAVPEDYDRIEQAAGLLADYGSLPVALELFQRASNLKPDLHRLYLRIGQTQQKLGEFSEAHQSLLEAIRKAPKAGPAYLLLAHNQKAADSSDERLTLCRQALELPSLSEDTRICLHFALGKLLDDTSDYEHAFEQFRNGNVLRQTQIPFNWPVWQQHFLDLQQIMPLSAGSAVAQKTPIPVFIVGMPRSGTTLVHRVLSSHPSVYGLGETEMVSQLVETLATHAAVDYPGCLSRFHISEYDALADQYRARWPKQASDARYILDKNPLNFMHIGLITRLFPDAQFIHCIRDPRDIALSVYFQNFAHPKSAYAYDLTDIGRFYTGYYTLMESWKSKFSHCIHTLRYERLVNSPESEIRRLLSTLDLEWDDACMAPETGDQEISTASVWQARQPFYSDSVGRWRHYEQQLKPFIDAVPPFTLLNQH